MAYLFLVFTKLDPRCISIRILETKLREKVYVKHMDAEYYQNTNIGMVITPI